MLVLRVVVNCLAIVAALGSAALWFWAAKVPLDPKDFAVWGGLQPEGQRLFTKQVRLNGYAALATGISAALQGISMTM